MKNRIFILLVLAIAVLLSTAYAASPQAKSTEKANSTSKAKATDSRGAELFAIHCGRCHKPPEDLSPRVAPAVIAHMRTRAMLSQKDEQAILEFLAP